jgi:hypothetical protein
MEPDDFTLDMLAQAAAHQQKQQAADQTAAAAFERWQARDPVYGPAAQNHSERQRRILEEDAQAELKLLMQEASRLARQIRQRESHMDLKRKKPVVKPRTLPNYRLGND